ncbi:alkaline phosphatase-like protein [Ascodesmis nigricans]|uniref:Alkaline phosphatase n=1 Tax=Ascodesmis nigricans TaxID=341454 RepID=A0A4S2N5P0_9PEZI|nr:alkaline phosphatase-like protein [Ascodesmis nigricans]
MADRKPLLSSDYDVKADAEDAQLLSGARAKTTRKHRTDHWIKLGLGVWAALGTIAMVAVAILCTNQVKKPDVFPPKGKRSVIFMVSDGMGPTSLELTRAYMQHTKNLDWDSTLTLDDNLLGTSRTRSSSSLVTDSAAGATAFGCALKSYNGAIAVLPDGSPCGTVLEAAKLAGYATGLVVTTRMTDATPACFSAHVNLRSEEDRIAEQQIGDYPLGRVVDLMLGGGRCHFLPNNTDGSCRADNRDLVSEAQKKYGFSYVGDRSGFDKIKKEGKATLPLLGLFAEKDIPFEIDRKDKDYPSLVEMAEVALNLLEEQTKDSDKGFFLMVEGSRIDHAGHGNDPAAQVREVLGYDKTFKKMLEWVEKHDAVLVSTSDHETGGLAAARQLHPTYPEYLWYPQVLANASHSSEYVARQYAQYQGDYDDERKFITDEVLAKGLGIQDASDHEISEIIKSKNNTGSSYVFADMISRRAQIGWSTHGHSAVDVNIYGSKGAERLRGNHENTDVGQFLADYLGLDLKPVSDRLKHEGVGPTELSGAEPYPWMGRGLEELRKLAELEEDYDPTLHHHTGLEHIDTYHGDFRKRSGGACGCGL